HKGTIAPPADGCLAVVIRAQNTGVDFLGDGGVPQGLCASPPKLSLLLAPTDRDVLGGLEVLGCHGDLGDWVKGASHEDDGAGLGDDCEEFFVGRPSGRGDAGVDGSHDLNVSSISSELVLLDGDYVAALED